MTTARQLASNRANAMRSTGPRSPEGKAVVALNSVTHGLTATTIVHPAESREDFIQYRNEMLDDLAPQSRFELDIAERIIANSWRLRRVPGIEIRVNPLPHELEFPEQVAQDPYYANGVPEPEPVEHYLANAWRNEPVTRRYHCLHRHEAHLHRMITRDLRSLTQRQRERDSDSSDVLIPPPEFENHDHDLNLDPVDPPDPAILSNNSSAPSKLHSSNFALHNSPHPPDPAILSKGLSEFSENSVISVALCENSSESSDPVDPPDPVILSKSLQARTASPTPPLIPHHLQSTGFALQKRASTERQGIRSPAPQLLSIESGG